MGFYFSVSRWPSTNLPALFFVILGTITILYKGYQLKISKELFFGLLTGVGLGASILFDKKALQFFDIFVYTFLANLIATIATAYRWKTYLEAKQIFAENRTKLLIITPLSIIGLVSLVFSLSRSDVSVVGINISVTFLISTVTLGIIFLNERQGITKKIIETILSCTGIVLLNIF